MSVIKEFKEFALKGNVLDLAVAVIIGAAFGAIITSFVGDIITPLILAPALKAAGVEEIKLLTYNGIKYGSFISAIINFFVVAFALFVLVKAANSMKKKEEAAPATPPEPSNEEKLLTEIRDLLKK